MKVCERLGRALIVEDDPAWRSIIAEALADEGVETDFAESLVEAQQLMHFHIYRLAVVDLSLSEAYQPNRKGLEVLAAIRRQAPFCPSILLTGYATVEIAVAALREYGALTCLRKETFTRAHFRALVREILASAPVAISSKEERTRIPEPLSEEKEEKRESALVVDDDAGWRVLLGELLSEAGFRVQICGGLGEALSRLHRYHFDVAVVDLSLVEGKDERRGGEILEEDEKLSGIRLLDHIHARGIPTIVVSGLSSPRLIERLYAEGRIHTFLEKPTFERAMLLRVLAEIRSRRSAESPWGVLTDRERQILELLVEGYSNAQIAEKLVISLNTVKRHLKSIFAKLGVRSRAGAVALVMKHREQD
ncbi:response regulator [uncultured Thermanaerothrix sp.]|uniref:response regulator transcription factor n=1 Tax=uncultured Thermanaerothrix sp. TaxID=1195149 RepID=UPI0026142A59|nr:response regulator [uncultured Thermanaerothrix sp.]